MAGKGKKKQSVDGSEKKSNKAPKKPMARKGESKSKVKSRCHVDIFNEHAMENAYVTCHNVQDLLRCRGFPWPDAQKKKKKGKKK
ncbi:small lysine-rich protein 1 [Nilaparvata lugens]|uniref:small lysine-rich protein 1 n=1 Tax=Nilaparvata lugens TaxID=108931 RepID=UPI000B984A37|nr:small lysine-rich protein 1 [Nilaparvata lugens]